METNSKQLIENVRAVVRDADELIRATASDVTERTREARAKLAGAALVAKETCNKLEHQGSPRREEANDVIRQYLYEAIGAAFGAGLVLGVLISRR